MTAGLTIWFDDGTYQIDSNIKTSTMVHKQVYSGPFTEESNPYVDLKYTFTVTIPNTVRSVFFSSSVERLVALFTKVGTTWRFKTNVSAPITMYGFSDTVPVVPSRFGLQLFNELGELTYDSNSKMMRVSNALSSASDGTVINFPIATGKTYAAGIGSYPRNWRGVLMGNQPGWMLAIYALRIGPNRYGVTRGGIAWRPVGGGGQVPPDSPLMNPPSLMLLDVSNY